MNLTKIMNTKGSKKTEEENCKECDGKGQRNVKDWHGNITGVYLCMKCLGTGKKKKRRK